MNFTEKELTSEIWKDIDEYEGLYQISDLGRVKSLKTRVLNRGGSYREVSIKILKLGLDKDGYCLIGLTKNGKYSTKKVHRLVCQAFHPNPENLPLVNHKDEDKSNNRKNNVEWCTHRYNSVYSKPKDRTSSYSLGVCWKKNNSNWTAHLFIEGSQKHLGSFKLEKDAGMMYDKAVEKIDSYKGNISEFRELIYKEIFLNFPDFSLIRRKNKNKIYNEEIK